MHTLEKLQSALKLLKTKRIEITCEGWYLQDCWLVQVKPGGNARTDRKYWQVRSRQAIFNGKTLKHLKQDQLEDYRTAIARGRQLKQIDRQIQKLQQQLERLMAKTNLSATSSTPCQSPHQVQKLSSISVRQTLETQTLSTVKFTDLAEQELVVKQTIAKSQELRASLRQSVAVGKLLLSRTIDFRRGHSHLH
ncbi:MAG: hypothetical protein V7K89_01690 [Nostoc sp.]|uniref:hypothetical protein n=1 Tax=Nostoc sp. TaxID=1180 RepID=UPI002FF53B6E